MVWDQIKIGTSRQIRMTHAQAKARHAELVGEIHKHDRAYESGHPLITDYE